jgi:hypothetical protein
MKEERRGEGNGGERKGGEGKNTGSSDWPLLPHNIFGTLLY